MIIFLFSDSFFFLFQQLSKLISHYFYSRKFPIVVSSSCVSMFMLMSRELRTLSKRLSTLWVIADIRSFTRMDVDMFFEILVGGEVFFTIGAFINLVSVMEGFYMSLQVHVDRKYLVTVWFWTKVPSIFHIYRPLI